jgi:hypothetical protein
MANPLPIRTPTGESQTEKPPHLASFPSSSQLSASGKSRISPAASFLKRSPSSAQKLRRRASVEHPDLLQTGKPRRFKSQYPLDSSERHVEYILVASFHIDRGPIMEHQYPAPISGDESMLAELMLPDQTHVRSQDWTIFFLHKDTGEDDEDADQERKKKRKKRRKNKDTEGQEDQDNDLERDAEESSDDDDDDDDDDDNEDDDDDEEEEGGEGPPLMYVLNLVNTKQDNTVRRLVFTV